MADLDHERKLLLQGLRLRHFRLVLSLYETRSVARTAELHHVSAAAISKTRAEIEALVGGPLFTHGQRRWEPTAIGMHLVTVARRLMAELECLSGDLVQMRRGLHGSVTLGFRTNSMLSFIAAATSEFKAAFPRVTVRLIDGALSELLDRMSRSEVDLILSPMVGENRAFETMSAVLRREDHVVVASRGHVLEGRTKLGWADLVEHAWCMPPVGTRTRDQLEETLARTSLPFPSDMTDSNSILMTIVLMQRMPLLSLVPAGIAWQMEPEIAGILPVTVDGVHDSVRLIWPARLAMSATSIRFRDFVVDLARDMPPSRAIRDGDGLAIEVGPEERRFRFPQPV